MRTGFSLRRDTFKNCWINNPFLELGEMILIYRESDNGNGTSTIDATSKCIGYAIGDGIHYFRDLDIFVNNTVTKTTGEIYLGTQVVDSYSVTDTTATYKQLTGTQTVTATDYLFASSGLGGGSSEGGAQKNYFTKLYLVTDSQATAAGSATDYSDLESCGYVLKLTANSTTPSDKINIEATMAGYENDIIVRSNVNLEGSLTLDEEDNNINVEHGTIYAYGNINTSGNVSALGDVSGANVTAKSVTNSVSLVGSSRQLKFASGSTTATMTFDGYSKITSTAYLYKS